MSLRGLRRVAKAGLERMVETRRTRGVESGLPLSLWGLARDGRGTLVLHGQDLRELVARYGSPLHVVDARRLDDNAAAFQAHAPRGERPLVCYSYKTNPVRAVLERLHAQGLGAEVISAYELWLAGRLGVAPEKIIYNGPLKSDASLREAAGGAAGLVNLNSRTEIPRVAQAAKGAGRRLRVGVRASFPDGWGQQFGEDVASGAALRAFREAMAVPELHVVALHVHRGHEIATREEAESLVDRALAFADELRTALGLEIDTLDIGGSLACPSTPPYSPLRFKLNSALGMDLEPRRPEQVLAIGEYVALVTSRVELHYRGRRAPTLVLEPGRALTANTQILLTSVHDVRDRVGSLAVAILDAGMNLTSPLASSYHQLLPVSAPPGAPLRAYRLAGPICTPADILYRNWRLPELAAGDVLAIMDAGAYFVPFSTSFSFPQPAIVMLDAAGPRLVRRAETFEDLVARDQPDSSKG